MPKKFWIGLASLILVLSGASIYFGFRPKPIVVVRPSNIENLETLGAATYRQLRGKWKETNWVAIGVPPNSVVPHKRIVDFLNGFSDQASKDQWSVQTILDFRTGLDTSGLKFQPKVESAQEITAFSSMTATLANNGGETLPERRLILLPAGDAIHRDSAAIKRVIESSLKTVVPSILFLKAGQSRDDNPELVEPCDLTNEREQILSLNLGCFSKRQTVTFAISRKTDHDKPLVSVEMASSFDVVVYLGSKLR